MRVTFTTEHNSRWSGNETYQTGAKADFPDTWAQRLFAMGVANEGWGVVVQTATTPLPDEPEPEPEPEPEDFSGLTLAELKDLAKERGVEGYYRLRKAELIEVLR